MEVDCKTLRDKIVGCDRQVPLLNGKMTPYINFDNAASTPPFKKAMEALTSFFEWYSSIHRGAGFKSQLASEVYDSCRDVVADFVGADAKRDAIIFVSGTTDAINRLSYCCPLKSNEKIVISHMEHHANDLPWRRFCDPIRMPVSSEGILDPEDLRKVLEKHKGKVKLFSVTGASNVVGTVVPIHELAEICHEYSVKIMIDAAQLIPHRQVDMKPHDDPQHIDFLAFSAHKMYAPFGSGVLVAPRELLDKVDPAVWGGGAVAVVAVDEVVWLKSPEREEAGSPNVGGVVAMAAAMKELKAIGYDTLQRNEDNLMVPFLNYLKDRPEITPYGITDTKRINERLGVFSFNITGIPHALVAAILSYEGGIGVRNGCFCAHPFILQLLQVPDDKQKEVRQRLVQGVKDNVPGAVRVSFGLYNTTEEVETLVEVLNRIIEHRYEGKYLENPTDGAYYPTGEKPDFRKYFGW
jgi:cysteine desulfurase/selenocysteine lyase